MTISQTVINERCNRWLADILERRSVPNPHDLAKYVTTELLAQGLAPVPRPFPLKATAPVASEEARRAAREAAADAVAAAKAKRTRVGPPPTPSVEDLVAGAALLGLNQDDVATAIEQLDLPAPTADDQPAVGYRCESLGQHAQCDLATCQCECHEYEGDDDDHDWQTAIEAEGERLAEETEPDEPVSDTWGPDAPPF